MLTQYTTKPLKTSGKILDWFIIKKHFVRVKLCIGKSKPITKFNVKINLTISKKLVLY